MVSRVKELSSKKVIPGDPICTEEEFMPGVGTYEHNGLVRAALTGSVNIDMNKRVVHVRAGVREPLLPHRGVVVYAIITSIREDYALVRIVSDINGAKYSTPFTAILHISQATEKYVKDLYELLRVGDIVKAKVLNNYVPYNVTIKEPKLGVVLSFCSKCGAILKYEGNDILKCPVCGNRERRKVSIDYGKLKGLVPWIR